MCETLFTQKLIKNDDNDAPPLPKADLSNDHAHTVKSVTV